jgi:hypothetical protein
VFVTIRAAWKDRPAAGDVDERLIERGHGRGPQW